MVSSIGSGVPSHGKPSTSESANISKKVGDRSDDPTARPGRRLDELSSGIKVGRHGAPSDAVRIKHARLAASTGVSPNLPSDAPSEKRGIAGAKTLIEAVGHAVQLQENLLAADAQEDFSSEAPVSELSRLTDVIRVLSGSTHGSVEAGSAGGHAQFLSAIDTDVIVPFLHLAEQATEVLARSTSDTSLDAVQSSDTRSGLLASLGELKAELQEINGQINRDFAASGGFAAGGHDFFTDGAARANARATHELILSRPGVAVLAHDPILSEEAFVLLQD